MFRIITFTIVHDEESDPILYAAVYDPNIYSEEQLKEICMESSGFECDAGLVILPDIMLSTLLGMFVKEFGVDIGEKD